MSNQGQPKSELIRLDSMAINEDGSLTKTQFFNFLNMDLDDYSDVVLTREEAVAFKNSVVRMTYGTSAAIPLRCSGERCFNKLCPLHKSKKYPIAKQCMYEVRMMNALFKSYMEDLDVEPDCRTEMVLVNKLVECDIIDFRANLGLSGSYDEEAGRLLKTSIIESEHSTSETTDVHPLIEIKDRTSVTRNKVLEYFAATRKEKYKKAAALKQSEDTDASNYFAEMREKLNNAANIVTKKVVESDWEKNDL
jgi:hypothetical protein